MDGMPWDTEYQGVVLHNLWSRFAWSWSQQVIGRNRLHHHWGDLPGSACTLRSPQLCASPSGGSNRSPAYKIRAIAFRLFFLRISGGRGDSSGIPHTSRTHSLFDLGPIWLYNSPSGTLTRNKSNLGLGEGVCRSMSNDIAFISGESHS